jgi:Uma2 family endonuclease
MAEPARSQALPAASDGRAWPIQGAWTYEDYLRLPEDGNRYELIRGFLYVTPPPIYDHQFVLWCLSQTLGRFVHERRLGIVLMAPFAVRLPARIGNPVEPDLVFLWAEQQPRSGDKFFQGAPALVLEVLSPSTRRRDRTIKLDAYRDAGVPEYWLVDPEARTVVVHVLSEDRRRYTELCQGGEGDVVRSAVLSGLEVSVGEIFPPRS